MPDCEQAGSSGLPYCSGVGPIHIRVLDNQGKITSGRVIARPSRGAEEASEEEKRLDIQPAIKRVLISHVEMCPVGFYLPR